jgi:uncharacterized membrane protein YoaK (UPF0700 family)
MIKEQSSKQSAPHYENVHILIWLIKDACWLMQWKWAGAAMIVPTLGVAIALAVKSYSNHDFSINLAICFWIIANAYWMCCEFFWPEVVRDYAAIPFVLGLFCVAIYYAKLLLATKS